MHRSKALMLGVAVLAGLLVLSVVTFGVLSNAAADSRGSGTVAASGSGSNNTTNQTGPAPHCAGPGMPPPPPPTNSTGNRTLPPPPPPGCPPPGGAPGSGSGGCGGMPSATNATASAEDESE